MVFNHCMFSTSSFANDSNGRKQFALTFQFHVIKYDIVNCLKHVIEWSNAHFMKINPEKTEILLLCPTYCFSFVNGVIFENQTIRFSTEVKNVGVWLDKNLRMDKHVNHITSHCYKNFKDVLHVVFYSSRQKKRIKFLNDQIFPPPTYYLKSAFYIYLINHIILTKVQNHQTNL